MSRSALAGTYLQVAETKEFVDDSPLGQAEWIINQTICTEWEATISTQCDAKPGQKAKPRWQVLAPPPDESLPPSQRTSMAVRESSMMVLANFANTVATLPIPPRLDRLLLAALGVATMPPSSATRRAPPGGLGGLLAASRRLCPPPPPGLFAALHLGGRLLAVSPPPPPPGLLPPSSWPIFFGVPASSDPPAACSSRVCRHSGFQSAVRFVSVV